MCCGRGVSNVLRIPARQSGVQTAVRVALLVLFAWMVGRFWHPYFGFTRFLMLDEQSAAILPAGLREAPIFTYRDGYDGHYYAQLAARPGVNDPDLKASVDSLSYRARRILLSWLAWVAGGGDAVEAMRAYAWVNLVIWAALAALLWRLLPTENWRATAGWAGILYSAGALHGVRLALPDVLALLLVIGAVMAHERGRPALAAGLLGAGGLTRETSLLGAASWLPQNWRGSRVWLAAAGWTLVAICPLATWMVYLAGLWGWSEPGVGNFSAPMLGFLGKWAEVARRLVHEPDVVLSAGTLLAHIGLTVQAAWIIWRREPGDAWWRVGAIYVLLLLVLGTAVWEGHPGAATRVLLPLTAVFNVLIVRRQAHWGWLVLGNLTVVAGLTAFRDVPHGEREIASGRHSSMAYVSHTVEGWYRVERHESLGWAWTAQGGEIELRCRPGMSAFATIELTVRSVTPRDFTVRQDGVPRLTATIENRLRAFTIKNVRIENGVARLRLETTAAAVPENADGGGRKLGLALYGVRLIGF